MQLPIHLQETYCDFAMNTKLQILFNNVSVESFWVSTEIINLELNKYAHRLLIPLSQQSLQKHLSLLC